MNERIRELQKQSSVEQWDYDNGCYRYVLNPEKFAELIAQESANYLENEYGKSVITGNDAADFIRKHFGVEE